MISGRVHLVGDEVDTDMIIPGRYLSLQDPLEIARHVFEGVDPGFAGRVRPGDVLVAGRNFGGGSSREHAPLGLLGLGLGAVVAMSFARIFYRNAINVGLPIFVSPGAAGAAVAGKGIAIIPETGVIELEGQSFSSDPPSPLVAEIIASGGLVSWVRIQLASGKVP